MARFLTCLINALLGQVDSFNLTALVAGCQCSFRSVRVLNFLSDVEEFTHLHPNRPSDQLSWRTPRRTLVDELGAAIAPALARLRGDPNATRDLNVKQDRIFAEPTDREPIAR